MRISVLVVLSLMIAGAARAEVTGLITLPAGTNGQVQFNNNSRFGGIPGISSACAAGQVVSTATVSHGVLTAMTCISLPATTDYGPSTGTLATNLSAEIARATSREQAIANSTGTIYAALNSTASALSVLATLTAANTTTIYAAVNSTGSALTVETARAKAAEAAIGVSTASLSAGGATTYLLVKSTATMAYGVTDAIQASGNTGSSYAVDWSKGLVSSMTLTAATVTLSFTNTTPGQTITLELTQDGSGSRVVTWPTSPATIKWGTSGAPTLTTAANKTDIVSFFWDGTSLLGFVGGQGF